MSDSTNLDRFNGKLSIQVNGCWLWTGVVKANGYGTFYVTEERKKVHVHRWSYATFVGPIPAGYEVDHLCRMRACVNPQHLQAVTLQENRQRRVASKTHCCNGHLYTPESTYKWTDRNGYLVRRCRTCNTRLVAERRRASAAS